MIRKARDKSVAKEQNRRPNTSKYPMHKPALWMSMSSMKYFQLSSKKLCKDVTNRSRSTRATAKEASSSSWEWMICRRRPRKKMIVAELLYTISTNQITNGGKPISAWRLVSHLRTCTDLWLSTKRSNISSKLQCMDEHSHTPRSTNWSQQTSFQSLRRQTIDSFGRCWGVRFCQDSQHSQYLFPYVLDYIFREERLKFSEAACR